MRIAEFQFHLGSSELRSASGPVALEPRVAQLLAYLLRNAGRIVSREELLASVWPADEGSDGALSYAVRRARQALGVHGHAAISTCRGRGYRVEIELLKDVDEWESFEANELIERRAELDYLRTQFETCRARKQPVLLVLTGMAGSGKTALLQHFRRELRERSERVLFTPVAELPSYTELERLAARRALAVFIEDVHEGAQSALDALLSAATRGSRPVFFVATCRTPLAPAQSERLRSLLRAARTLTLEALSDAGARRLLRGVSAQPLSPALEQRLLHLGAGNPLFLRELAAARTGEARSYGGGLLLAPSAMNEALRRHLSDMPEATLELLRCAGLMGEEFDARLLQRERHGHLREVVMALEPAIAQQVVQPLSQLQFRFKHPLFREYLCNQLTDLQRREQHWAIGLAIERLGHAELERKLPRLLFHLSQGAVCQEQTAKAARLDRWATEQGLRNNPPMETGGNAE